MFLEGERVRLRPFDLADAPSMRTWVDDPEIVRLLGGVPYPFSLAAEEAPASGQRTNEAACTASILPPRGHVAALGAPVRRSAEVVAAMHADLLSNRSAIPILPAVTEADQCTDCQ
jgi:hypothetical protein